MLDTAQKYGPALRGHLPAGAGNQAHASAKRNAINKSPRPRLKGRTGAVKKLTLKELLFLVQNQPVQRATGRSLSSEGRG